MALILFGHPREAAGSALEYIRNSGRRAPEALPNTCATLCTPVPCDADKANNSYRCLWNCAHHQNVNKIFTCVNSQFAHYTSSLRQQIHQLIIINGNQTNEINDLENRLEQARNNINDLNLELQNRLARINAQDEQARRQRIRIQDFFAKKGC